MQEVTNLFESDAKKYFPKPTRTDMALFQALPDEFSLSVPYIQQETRSGSGSACLQMLCAFHGLDASKGVKLLSKSEANWKQFNHETLEEDFTRVALQVGLLPYVYYPGRFVLPKFREGFEGADFIAKNFSLVSPFDRHLMKAAIFSSRSPLFARIHFATDEYRMPESMASVLDTSGHALLLCGWNKEGFLVHDSWRSSKWGGYGGGEYRLLTYKRLSEMKPLVNCCAEASVAFLPLNGFVRAWENAVFENRDMPIRFQLETPVLPSYYLNYVTWDYAFGLRSSKNVRIRTSPKQLSYQAAHDSKGAIVSWEINTGPKAGSHALAVNANAFGTYPVFPWETAKRSSLTFSVSRTFHTRLDVKRLDWLNKYARVSET